MYYQISQKTLTNFAHPNAIFKSNFLKYINDDNSYNTKKEWEKIKKKAPRYIVVYKEDNIEKIFKKLEGNKNFKFPFKSVEIIDLGIYKIVPLDFITK